MHHKRVRVIRTASDPAHMGNAIRKRFALWTPRFPFREIRTMDDVMGRFRRPRFLALILTLFQPLPSFSPGLVSME